MKLHRSLDLALCILSVLWCRNRVVSGFHQPSWGAIIHQQPATRIAAAGSWGYRRGNGGGGGVASLHAKPADPPSSSSAAPGKKGEEHKKKSGGGKKRRPRRSGSGGGGWGNKSLVKQAVEAWAEDSLDLRRFQGKRVHICEAETLPEVLSDFWSLASELAHEKYMSMAGDRDYAGHALFVVARCDLLKDYGVMRQLDKVLDFCSGGCSDFGRTVTLQHYHPDFVLPPLQRGTADDANRKDLARFISFSRSPYPVFGLTASAGAPVRPSPFEVRSDKIARLRLELELVYNSVAGRSTDDSVDSHGSPHGTLPTSPVEVYDTTIDWLRGLPWSSSPSPSFALDKKRESSGGERRVETDAGGGEGKFVGAQGTQKGRLSSSEARGRCSLSSSYEGDLVTSGVNTPEKMLSEVWSVVSKLQKQAAPILAAADKQEEPSFSSPPIPSSSSCSTSPRSPFSLLETVREIAAEAAAPTAPPPGGAAATATAAAAALTAAAVAAVERWATGGMAAPEHSEGLRENEERREEAGDRERVKQQEAGGDGGWIVSSLVVAPRLHPFNAAKFESFARNLAIALKQAPIMDRIEVEVYHPELVCEGGIVDLDRRSPFPTLLLKHCGFKEVLFEPSGKFRNALPPPRLPLDNIGHAQDGDNEGANNPSEAPDPAGDVSAGDDAQQL